LFKKLFTREDKNYNIKYLKRAVLIARVLEVIPAILLIGISGSLSRGEAEKKSDIDFFIVSRRGQIFTSRFLAKTISFFMLSLRRKGAKNYAGKICLNYFLSEDSLDFKPHDNKVVFHYQRSIILFSRGDLLKRLTEENRWLKPRFDLSHHRRLLNYRQNCKKITLEKFLKRIQQKKIFNDPDYRKNQNGIIISDLELRFHPKKRRRADLTKRG
jgi:predicted nucleotidyltransferase